MRIVSWNVNGLRASRTALIEFLGRGALPDVICLQETRCPESVARQVLEATGYAHVATSTATKAGYSGVAIASTVKPQRVFTAAAEAPEAATTEGRIIAAEFDACIVISCYTPNSKPDLARLEYRTATWEPWIRDWLRRLMAGPKPVVLAGDLNVAPERIDIHNPDAKGKPRAGYTSEERAAFAALVGETGLVDAFRALHPRTVRYSWWSNFGGARDKNKGWRIDFVMCDPRLDVVAAEVMSDVRGSDHAPVSATVALMLC